MKGKTEVLKFEEQDTGRTIEAGAGQEFELRLPENPTAGFRWHVLCAGEGVCTRVDHAYEPGGQPGQPGVHRWRFKITAPGSTTLELAYRRAWESDAAPARRFSLRLQARQ